MADDQFLALELDELRVSPITEAAGLVVGQDVVELKRNTTDGKYVIVRVPPDRPRELVMVRGRTDDDGFARWLDDARAGRTGPLDGALSVCDARGSTVRRYKLTGVVPKSLMADTGTLTEKLVVTYEAMEEE